MNKLISLTKLQLKDFFSRYRGSLNIESNLLGNLLMLFVTGSLLIPAFQLSFNLYNAFAYFGQPELMITYLYVATILMLFITSISFIVSIFFYSKDTQFLASLPIPETTIVFSKLSTIYIYLMGISGVIFIPALIIFAIRNGFTFSVLIFGIIALILLPVLPLLISSVIILPVMRMVSNSRRRNLFSILAGLGMLVLIIGVQLFITKNQMNPEYLQQIFTQKNGLLYFIGRRFPPSVWVTKMLLGSITDMFYFLGLNALLALLLRTIAKTFYHHTLLQFNQESTSIRAGKLYYIQRSKGFQLIRRHILIILKQPTFFLNTLISLIVPFFMFGIMFFTGEVSLTIFKTPQVAPFLGLIFAGSISSPAIIANISSTVITREGKAFWETKVLPISAMENIRYRVLSTVILNFLGSILLTIACLILMPLTFSQFILGVLLCITLTFFLATVDIIVNIKRPFLDWTNPTAAVKNNLNVIISLCIRLIIAFFLFLLIKFIWSWGITTISLILAGIFMILYIIARYLLAQRFADQFTRIPI